MVLKTNDYRAAGSGQQTESQIADHSVMGSDGIKINGAQIFTVPAVRSLIRMPQQLIAPADTQERNPILNGRFPVFLFLSAVFQQQGLLKVLSAADKEEIISGKIHGITDVFLIYNAVDPSPFQTFPQAEDIAPVPIQIQNIRIQVTYFQLHDFSSSQNLPLPERAARRSRISSMAV